ncbi:hypothetical protein H0E87_031592, partial [Populus deltoides]
GISGIGRLVKHLFDSTTPYVEYQLIEPDTNATEMKDADNKLLVEKLIKSKVDFRNVEREEAPSKKRKPNKSKDTSRKKSRGAAYTSLAQFRWKI